MNITAEQKQPHRWLLYWLAIATLEGLAAWLLMFTIPSEPGSRWLLGLSVSRLALVAGFGLVIGAMAFVTYKAHTSANWLEKISIGIRNYLFKGDQLLLAGYFLFFTLLFCVFTVISFSFYPQLQQGFLGTIYQRVYSLIWWIILSTAQMLMLLLLIYRDLIRERRYLNSNVIFLLVVLALGLGSAFLHWILLSLDLPWLTGVPGWFWLHFEKPGVRGWVFFTLLVVVLITFVFTLVRPWPRWRSLLLQMAAGYLLLLGMGFVEGTGLETLRLKIFGSNHQIVYSHWVSHDWMTPGMVSEYEERFNQDMFLGTKPPGVLFLYSGFQKLSERIYQPDSDYESRLFAITRFIAAAFPLFTILALPLLFLIGKKLLGEDSALLPGWLYISAPNVLLMPLGFDKALFPILFLSGVLLILQLSQRRTFLMGLLSGAYLYVSLYFSFSLQPLLMLAPLWLVVSEFNLNRRYPIKRLLFPFLGIGVGFGVMALFFWGAFDYAIWVRYSHAMEWHRQVNGFAISTNFLLNAIRLNNLELASWVGFPLAILTVSQVFRSGISVFKNQFHRMDLFAVVAAVVYLFLNILAQLRGEVGRTWLFLLPIFALICVHALNREPRLKRMSILFLVSLQLVLSYFMLAYQCPCVGG